MEKLLKLFRKLTGQKTVSDVLAVFNKAVDELEDIANRESERAGELLQQSYDLRAQADKANVESNNAVKAAAKIRQLLA